MFWKSVAREPLVHFVAIGIVLFMIDAWRSEPEPVPAPASPAAAPTKTIVVDAGTRAQIAKQAEQQLGHAPSADELATATDHWIDEEVLFREALARGLERDDPMIHQRIASRMAYVLEQTTTVPEPSDAELRVYFDAHRELWEAAERIDFTHVFVTDEARLGALADALAAGAPPETLGDRFSGGRRYRGRKLADLASAFGDEFVVGLATQKPDTWVRRRSRHGFHLVRVDRVEASRAADFEAARLDVRKAWLDERRAREIGAAIRALRGRWEIVTR